MKHISKDNSYYKLKDINIGAFITCKPHHIKCFKSFKKKSSCTRCSPLENNGELGKANKLAFSSN